MAIVDQGGAIRVTGVDKVLARLDEKIKAVKFRTKGGLIKAGLLIQRQAQQKTPVDTGNLKSGAFTIWSGSPSKPPSVPSFSDKKGGSQDRSRDHAAALSESKAEANVLGNTGGPTVIVGFSAAYAIYVHEGIQGAGREGVKFLENAVRNNQRNILAAIQGEVSKETL